jgi:hypothetical protein
MDLIDGDISSAGEASYRVGCVVGFHSRLSIEASAI